MSSSEQLRNNVEQVPVADPGPWIAALREGSREARLSAIEKLGKLGDGQGIDALADALKDPDEEVQKAASVQLMMMAFTSQDAGIKQRAAAAMRQWADQQPDAAPRRDPFPQGSAPSRIVTIVMSLAFGVVLWMIPVVGGGLVASAFTEGTSEVVALIAAIGLILLLIIPFNCALRGWGWMRQYGSGTYGEALKVLAMILIAMTFIGLIPIVYWTGKGGLEWLAQRGIIFS